ncbi:copper resistance CopC family protein [Paractinoplanes rishiriensis]|uniref:CopC domain-containing protein n=1 Tax=Paractinoplanes rishiriensis TaxID=1050105 RepID=A0A919K2K7_9ACTN|nr:copper resistance CopC family protein [Actinoplanes rishiriensis]GIE99721.1 hypothetical protein Ari01nite_71860 [Actinoplanes rishiriensis]
MRKLLIALAAGLAVLLPAAPAQAHNALAEATPKKDAVLTTAPAAVKLRFLQKLNPDYTKIVVSDAAKQALAAEEPKIDGNTVTLALMTAPGNGTFTVAYQTVSLDGHAVKGSYKFTVDDPEAPAVSPSLSSAPSPSLSSAPPPPAPTETPETIAAEPVASEGGMSTPVLIALAGAGAVLVAVAGGFWWRGRRRS